MTYQPPPPPTDPPGAAGPWGAPVPPVPPPPAYPPQPAFPAPYGAPVGAPGAPWGAPPSPWTGGPALRLSSPWKRFGAWWLDRLLTLVTLGIGWVIWSLVVWGNGQTPAKQLLHMRTVKRNPARPCTWGEMLLREFVLCGVLAAITVHLFKIVGMFFTFDDRRQALWDRMIDTTVVDEQ